MQQTAPRVDIYARIHKALRAQLSHVLVAAGRLDWRDDDDTATLLAELGELLDNCRSHLAHEATHVHPAMEACRPGSAARAEADHAHHLQDINRLTALADAIGRLPALRREQPVRLLYQSLARFVAENLEHMAHEEREHNRVLWDTHDDAGILAIEQAIVADIPPEKMQGTLRWMLPALDAADRADFLAGLREQAPPEVFAETLLRVRPLLPAGDRGKLDRALGLAPRPLDYVGIA